MSRRPIATLTMSLLAAAPALAAPATEPGGTATLDYWSMLYVFMLSTFIGIGVIRRVSRLLHTPLMSLTNAISAIAVVGSIIVTGSEHHPHPRSHRPVRLHDQHRERVPDHRPHAQDVQGG